MTDDQAADDAVPPPDHQGQEEDDGQVGYAFRIGARRFLIPLGLAAELTTACHCSRLPFTRTWCLGLANFRGDLVTVYDLGLLLEERGQRASGYFLMLGQREARAGLCVDEMMIVRIPSHAARALLPPLPNLSGKLDGHCLEVAGVTYIEIDLVALLGLLAEQANLFQADHMLPKDHP